MKQKKRLLAIPGSTRAASSNAALIATIASMTEAVWTVEFYQDLVNLPQFNPDADVEGIPALVEDLRRKVAEADGVLICTPEYAVGVPGALKNALDWTVSTTVFSEKPVALITASSSGRKAHQSLLGTLLVIGALMTEETALLISFVQTKVSKAGEILDAETELAVEKLIRGFTVLMDKGAGDPLLDYLISGGI